MTGFKARGDNSRGRRLLDLRSIFNKSKICEIKSLHSFPLTFHTLGTAHSQPADNLKTGSIDVPKKGRGVPTTRCVRKCARVC